MMGVGILLTCTIAFELFVLWRLRFDAFVMHPVAGPTILATILFFVFQADCCVFEF